MIDKHITYDNLDVAPQQPPMPSPWQLAPRPAQRLTWDVILARYAGALVTGGVAWYLLPPWLTVPAAVIGMAGAALRYVLTTDVAGVRVWSWSGLDAKSSDIVGFLGQATVQHAKRPNPNLSSYHISNAPGLVPALAADDEEIEEAVIEADPFDTALASLPRLVELEGIIDHQPGSFSVPLGLDHTGAMVWRDMRKDMLHVGIFGGTGAGKDNLFESWLIALTRQNTPEQVQFAVLDGKGHWTQPSIASRAHFWRPPAGGIGPVGQQQMQSLLTEIQAEADRRGKLVFGADCDTVERYTLKTGHRLPYLVVYFSDVMGNIVGDVDRLLVDLVSKARALGIRVVVSLQTPTKQNTQWRSNLSTVICGQLQGQSNDAPALGLPARDIQFPPSQLPISKDRPGVFSVRSGSDQFLIQAPLVQRDYIARVIAALPERPALTTGAAGYHTQSHASRPSIMDSYKRMMFKDDAARIGWLAWNTDWGTRKIREIVGCDYNEVVRIAGLVRAKKPQK